MDKRQLRIALQEKLEHRRRLMTENAGLRHNLRQERSRNDFLLDTLSNPLVNMALEDCADQIIRSVIEHAAKASQVVADQAIDNGDYEIGISIPSLHIRQRLFRSDMRDVRAMALRDAPIRRVSVDTSHPPSDT